MVPPLELPLFPVPAVDVAIAFQRGGFEIVIQTAERLVLERGTRRVVLNRGHVMQPPEILLLLRAANATVDDFLEWLAPAPRHASGTRPRVTEEELAEAFEKRRRRT